MFIFTIDQELWARELIDHIMGWNHSLGFKDFLNQLNLLYICNRSRVMDRRANNGLRPLFGPEGYI
jgi:hypothetical protein